MSETFEIKNGDVVISSATGRPFTVERAKKFKQDALENLSTEVQANGTGAGLDETIPKLGDVFSLRADVSRNVVESFAALKRVQQETQRFDRARNERVGRVALCAVLPLRDPSTGQVSLTAYSYRVDLLSEEGESPVTITGALLG